MCATSAKNAVALHGVLTRLSVFNPDHECWPSQETLAELAFMSVRSVKRALRVLESAGAVRTHRGYAEVWTDRNHYNFGGRGRHTVYAVAFDRPFPPALHKGHGQEV